MFKCNLTGATYEYKNMNLLELRQKMLTQFGLKPWDIYAGYSEMSVIDYKTKKMAVSAADTPWKVQLAKNIGNRAISSTKVALHCISTGQRNMDTEASS